MYVLSLIGMVDNTILYTKQCLIVRMAGAVRTLLSCLVCVYSCLCLVFMLSLSLSIVCVPVMAGAVWTRLSGLCLSIFGLGLLYCHCLFLLSVLSFLPLMFCVVEVFDGWQICI